LSCCTKNRKCRKWRWFTAFTCSATPGQSQSRDQRVPRALPQAAKHRPFHIRCPALSVFKEPGLHFQAFQLVFAISKNVVFDRIAYSRHFLDSSNHPVLYRSVCQDLFRLDGCERHKCWVWLNSPKFRLPLSEPSAPLLSPLRLFVLS
jgi:hypothetical protein